MAPVEYYERASALWLDGVRPAMDLRADLERLVHTTSWELPDPERFARYGAASVMPVITTATFAQADVRDLVVEAVAQIGELAAPTLITILEWPFFDQFYSAWCRAGVAHLGATSEAAGCCRFVYARTLETLDQIVRSTTAFSPWMPLALRLALAYRESSGAQAYGLFGPAYNLADSVRLKESIATGVFSGMGHPVPAQPGSAAASTGWSESVAQQGRREQQVAKRAAEEAARADFAAFFFADQARRRR